MNTKLYYWIGLGVILVGAIAVAIYYTAQPQDEVDHELVVEESDADLPSTSGRSSPSPSTPSPSPQETPWQQGPSDPASSSEEEPSVPPSEVPWHQGSSE